MRQRAKHGKWHVASHKTFNLVIKLFKVFISFLNETLCLPTAEKIIAICTITYSCT